MSKEKHKYKLIPLSEIDDEARKIAVAWIENYEPYSSSNPEIAQKQKLASDIINYASDRVLVRTKQFQIEINKLLQELESEKRKIKEFGKWLQEITDKETGPSSKASLQIILNKFKMM